MKIQIASDLHLEFIKPTHLPGVDAFRRVDDRDLLILAGDVGSESLAWEFIRRQLDTSPVIYVPGNHEYYSRRSHDEIDLAWKEIADEHEHLHYLTGQAIEIDGVRFWGGPWYSDLWGESDAWRHALVQRSVMDFCEPCNDRGAWTVSRHISAHHAQTDLLREHAGALDVVVTHWPPTKGAIHRRFTGDRLNPYFHNDKEDLVQAIGAKLWVSGHTHEAFDYQIGKTRCVGNPSGYPGEGRWSNLFRPDRFANV